MFNRPIVRCEHDFPWSWCRTCTPLLDDSLLSQEVDSDYVWITAKQDGACLNCGEYIESGVTLIAWCGVNLGFVCCTERDWPRDPVEVEARLTSVRTQASKREDVTRREAMARHPSTCSTN